MTPIISKRISLTKIQANDIPKIVDYANNAKIAEMTLNIPHPYSEDDAIFWVNLSNQGFKNGSQYTFAIRLNSTKEFIGGMGLIVEKKFDLASIGYWVAEPFWNNGYASEALGSLLKFGFKQVNLNKIYATHLIENPASGKVMIKNNMIKEGTLVDHVKKNEAYHSLVQYRLTKKEYLKINPQ